MQKFYNAIVQELWEYSDSSNSAICPSPPPPLTPPLLVMPPWACLVRGMIPCEQGVIVALYHNDGICHILRS